MIVIAVLTSVVYHFIALVCRRHLKKEKTQEPNRELNGGAAGEGTSGSSSTPLLSTELPAGLETSIPPAPSSETQPAEETTPLMSSESPAPTGDQQEHIITIPDATTDGHDNDQSLGPEERANAAPPSPSPPPPSTPPPPQSIPSTSQSIPSNSECRSGADIEMGLVPGFLNIDCDSLLKGNDITGDKVTQF
ncbi:unnamed protein product [Arctogadus glacialis]